MQIIDNIQPFCLHKGDTLMMALERLNACSPNSFLVVVDEAKHLCATLTDGDIRRGLLNGLALDAPISECMNTKPEVLQEADVPSASKLNRYGFLPQIDAKGCVRRIFANTSNGRRIPYAVIMAGGLGKRLHPHTLKTPKPLLPIAGRPLLARLLDKMDAANVSETLISVHYMADHFEQFVSQDKRSFTQVSLVYEEDMLGTAGCLSLLKDKLDEPVLVTNGDILSSLNFESFANFHLDSSFDATIAVTMYEVNIPYGVVDTDAGGEFASITEKPTHTHMVAAGVYMVSPTLLNLLQDGESIDMPDLLDRARDAGLKIGVYPFHEYWRDVGRPEDLKHADVDVDKGSV